MAYKDRIFAMQRDWQSNCTYSPPNAVYLVDSTCKYAKRCKLKCIISFRYHTSILHLTTPLKSSLFRIPPFLSSLCFYLAAILLNAYRHPTTASQAAHGCFQSLFYQHFLPDLLSSPTMMQLSPLRSVTARVQRSLFMSSTLTTQFPAIITEGSELFKKLQAAAMIVDRIPKYYAAGKAMFRSDL